jgi:hypothetical protein
MQYDPRAFAISSRVAIVRSARAKARAASVTRDHFALRVSCAAACSFVFVLTLFF